MRADCREHGLSTAATRDELLRRLMLHQTWAVPKLEGKLPDSLGDVTLEHYTATQLKIWCADKGLPHTGTKGDLIERLEGLSQGRSDHTGHVIERDIQSGSVQKYALFVFHATAPMLCFVWPPLVCVRAVSVYAACCFLVRAGTTCGL